MKITQDNLMDILGYYMEDNNIDYVNLKGSMSADGEKIKMSLIEDIEDELD